MDDRSTGTKRAANVPPPIRKVRGSPLDRRALLLSAATAGACACLAACNRAVRGSRADTPPRPRLADGNPTMPACSAAISAPVSNKPPAANPSAANQSASATQPATPNLSMAVFPDAKGNPIAHATDAPVILERRDQWTRAAPHYDQMVLMNGIDRITIHHTGFPEPWETEAWNTTAHEIEDIREFHVGTGPEDRGWADIAYHFVVDRAGRVWQARPLVYQGAHVRHHNAHNLGIVCMGNFDLQNPSAAQLFALHDFVHFVRKLYRVPYNQIWTHRELADNHTDCPGTSLFAYVERVRPDWK